MSESEILTIGGAIATLIGTIVTLYQAYRTRQIKEELDVKLKNISLSEARNHLISAERVSQMLFAAALRGRREAELYEELQNHLSNVTSSFPYTKPPVNLLKCLDEVSEKLFVLRKNILTDDLVYDLSEALRRALMECTATTY